MKNPNKKVIYAGIRLNRIVVIQSLESREPQTGVLVRDDIVHKLEEYQSNLSVEFVACETCNEFLDILKSLTSEAIVKKSIPLIHVECHGDLVQGLEFANASTLSWTNLAEALRKLNIATQFNLVAVFSACFGGHFLSQMGAALEPAPCWCMVAPTDTVDAGEILATFRSFYSAFINTNDIGVAIQKLSSINLSNGRWFAQTAEVWFEMLLNSYVKEQCTKHAARLRIKKLQLEILQNGRYASMGSLKRLLKKTNRATLLDDCFNNYFITDLVPENNHRFNAARQRVRELFDELRRTEKYII